MYKSNINLCFCFTSFLNVSEKNDPPPQSTTSAFSTVTLSTTSFMNGVTSTLLPSESPKTNEPLKANPEPVNQPTSYSCNPSHPLLSIHHTLYEEEEEEQGHRDKLVERPGELIAAGEC